MKQFFHGLENSRYRWVLVAVAITLMAASFLGGMGVGGNRNVIAPPVVSPDPDWFMAMVKVNAPTTFELSRIIEVIDGDTFKADLSRFGKVEEKGVKIRLAGINSPERFDQNCWREAKDFSKEWLTKSGKVFVEVWGKDTYGNRPVAFVYRSQPKQSLEEDLVSSGFALPCSGYLKNQVSSTKFESHKKMILNAASVAYLKAKPENPSVWSPKIKNLDISVLANNSKSTLAHGDKITLSFESRDFALDLTGFSLMDESSQPDHRFFLPKTLIGMDKGTVTINLGLSMNAGWISVSGNEFFAMSGTDWINDSGDTIYLRDSNRRVVAYAIYDPKANTR